MTTYRRQLDAAYRAEALREREIAAEKRALRNSNISKRELVSLQVNSNKWPELVEKFTSELSVLRQRNVRSAKSISKHFAKANFRTIGSLKLTPRLVDLLRKEWKNDLLQLKSDDAGLYEMIQTGGDPNALNMIEKSDL